MLPGSVRLTVDCFTAVSCQLSTISYEKKTLPVLMY